MATYIPRVFDLALKDKLASKGAVLVEGPTWRGKTTTCEQVASSVVYLQDPRMCGQNLRLIQLDPSFFLKGGTPSSSTGGGRSSSFGTQYVSKWTSAMSLGSSY